MKINKYNIAGFLFISIFLLSKLVQEKTKSAVGDTTSIVLQGVSSIDGKPLESAIKWMIVNKATHQVFTIDEGIKKDAMIRLHKSKSLEKNEWLLSAESKDHIGVSHLIVGKIKENKFEVVMMKKEAKTQVIIPEKVIATTNVKIKWHIPSYIDAKINIEEKEAPPNFYSKPTLYTLDHKNEEAKIRIPSEPGEYVVRLYDIKHSSKVLIENPIEISKAEIVIIYPAEVIAGTRFNVSWKVPDGVAGKINLKEKTEDILYFSRQSVKTKGRTTGLFIAPSKEGEYVLRWHDYYSRGFILERALKIKKAKIELIAKNKVKTGEKILIKWSAPKDSVARIYLRNEIDKKMETSFSVERKKEHEIVMPDQPGRYTLLWLGGADKQEMARHNIEVVDEH